MAFESCPAWAANLYQIRVTVNNQRRYLMARSYAEGANMLDHLYREAKQANVSARIELLWYNSTIPTETREYVAASNPLAEELAEALRRNPGIRIY